MTRTTAPGLGLTVDLLGDTDRDQRLRAALELGETAHAEAAAPLVERFGVERDFQVRETLTWAVLRLGDDALPLVREALTSPRWLARLQAVHTLSKAARAQDAARLVPLVADPVDAVAARTYWALAQLRDPATVPALVTALARGDAEHRNSLTVALGRFGAAAVPALAEALRTGTTAVRLHAADTLSDMGSPDAHGALDALVAAVDDPDETVRLAALNALGQLRLPAAWWAVDEASRSPQPRLRHLAGRLLERRPRGTAFAPLVTVEGGAAAERLAGVLARHVLVARPRHLSRADVPAAEVEEVREQAERAALGRGRDAATAARIAAGRVEQWVHEHVLLEQVCVVDPGVTVGGLLFGTGARVTGFARLDRP